MLDTLVRKTLVTLGRDPDTTPLDGGRAVLRKAAHHEAGHALARLALGDRMEIEYVTLDPDVYRRDGDPEQFGRVRTPATTNGPCSWSPARSPSVRYRRMIRDRSWAGNGAENPEWRGARRLAGDSATYRELVAEVQQLVGQHWPAVCAIAEAVLARGTLTGAEVDALLHACLRDAG